MTKYRLLTDSYGRYRIQKKVLFWWVWIMESDWGSQSKVIKEFHDAEIAKDYIENLQKKDRKKNAKFKPIDNERESKVYKEIFKDDDR